jgi:biopolymer transport protein ExbD
MARRTKRKYADVGIDMTPMIDVVFQLIIFFITAVDMQDKALDTKIQMAMSPHGPVEEAKDPRTITIDVAPDGVISIMRMPISQEQLYKVLVKAVNESGQSTPVVIRGDVYTPHEYIKNVMDVCGRAKLWKLRFAALKERA